MAQFVDLHMHTTCSDGVYTPELILTKVRESGVVAFSVTDHDSVEAYEYLGVNLTVDDPELVTGVELSVAVDGDDMHMHAYLFDLDSDEFNSALEDFQEKRNSRGRLMVQKLAEMGLVMPFEAVEEKAQGKVIGRPHIGEAMVERNLVSTFDEAFGRYLGNGRPAYLPKAQMTPEEAIELIHRAGGIAVIAHPYIGQMNKHIEALSQIGLDGIEVYHYAHSKAQTEQLKHMADRLSLVSTGGSDFHGRNERDAKIGSQNVPAELLEQMKKRALEVGI